MTVTSSVWVTSHFFGVSHSAVVTADTVIVLCDVRIEEEEAIEHQAYNTTYQKEKAIPKWLIFVLFLRINKTGIVSRKVTIRRVLVTIVVGKNSKYYIFCVSAPLFIQYAMRMRRFIL